MIWQQQVCLVPAEVVTKYSGPVTSENVLAAANAIRDLVLRVTMQETMRLKSPVGAQRRPCGVHELKY